MSDRHREARRPRAGARVVLVAVAALAAASCASLRGGGDELAPPPALAAPGTPDPLASLPTRATPVPDAPDFAAHDLAAAALAGTPEAALGAQRRLARPSHRLRGEASQMPVAARRRDRGPRRRTFSTPSRPTERNAADTGRCGAAVEAR